MNILSIIITLAILKCASTDLTFKLNPANLCQGRKEPELLIYIHSSAPNFRKREAIRMTWAHKSFYGIYNVKMVFVVGIPCTASFDSLSDSNPETIRFIKRQIKSTKHRLNYEFERYGDVIQGNFLDSYRNMTMKALHSLRWIQKHCSSAKFLLKADDDVIINIFKLLPFLGLKQKRRHYPRSTISCNVWNNAKPVRDKGDTWYISEEEYSLETYPPFCQGMAYFLTPDLIDRLYQKSMEVPQIFMDDVYITGILAEKLTDPKVSYLQLKREYSRAYRIGDVLVSKMNGLEKTFTFIHTDSVDVFLEAWRLIYDSYLQWTSESFLQKLSNNQKHEQD